MPSPATRHHHHQQQKPWWTPLAALALATPIAVAAIWLLPHQVPDGVRAVIFAAGVFTIHCLIWLVDVVASWRRDLATWRQEQEQAHD